jgi:hypothetical protein
MTLPADMVARNLAVMTGLLGQNLRACALPAGRSGHLFALLRQIEESAAALSDALSPAQAQRAAPAPAQHAFGGNVVNLPRR